MFLAVWYSKTITMITIYHRNPLDMLQNIVLCQISLSFKKRKKVFVKRVVEKMCIDGKSVSTDGFCDDEAKRERKKAQQHTIFITTQNTPTYIL